MFQYRLQLLCCMLITLPVLLCGAGQKFFFFNKVDAKRIPIGSAPRAWIAINSKKLFFTEQSKQPNNFIPGSCYRELYYFVFRTKRTYKIATLGYINSHPVIDHKRKFIYYNKRTQDTNRDKIISLKDNRAIYRIDTKGNNKELLTPENSDYQLIAFIPQNNKLLLRSKKMLFLLDPNTKEIIKIKNAPEKINTTYISRNGQLHIATPQGAYRLRGEEFRNTPHGATLYKSKNLSIIVRPISQKLLFQTKYFRKINWFTLSLKNVQYITTLKAPFLHLFIDLRKNRHAIFMGNIRKKAQQRIFAFPYSTTHIVASPRSSLIAFLVTKKSNRDGARSTSSLERSAIYYIQLGKWK